MVEQRFVPNVFTVNDHILDGEVIGAKIGHEIDHLRELLDVPAHGHEDNVDGRDG